MKMNSWIERSWNSCTEAEQQEIARTSRIICRTVKIDTARSICQDKIRELAQKYDFIRHACQVSVIDDPHFADENLVPYSTISFVQSYFSPFTEFFPEEETSWGTAETKVPGVSDRRRFLVRNGYHGDIIVTLSRETGGSYYFDYIKDGEVVFQDWKVLKNSKRILEEIF